MGLARIWDKLWGPKDVEHVQPQIPGDLKNNLQMLQSAASRLSRTADKIEASGNKLEIILKEFKGQ